MIDRILAKIAIWTIRQIQRRAESRGVYIDLTANHYLITASTRNATEGTKNADS